MYTGYIFLHFMEKTFAITLLANIFGVSWKCCANLFKQIYSAHRFINLKTMNTSHFELNPFEIPNTRRGPERITAEMS